MPKDVGCEAGDRFVRYRLHGQPDPPPHFVVTALCHWLAVPHGEKVSLSRCAEPGDVFLDGGEDAVWNGDGPVAVIGFGRLLPDRSLDQLVGFVHGQFKLLQINVKYRER